MAARPDELAHARPRARAAAELRFWNIEVSPEVVRALEEGTVLLVVRSSGIVLDHAWLPVADLTDLAGAEPPPMAEEDERTGSDEALHFIELLVVDALGEPKAGAAYEVVLPDGRVHTGRTAADGRLRIADLDQTGTCTLTFPEEAASFAAAA